MAAERAEPFQVALASLRERLREGLIAPGQRLAAAEVAGELKLSATPVREALSRLVGEGLLEDRRGQGFFVRVLSGTDIADLYRLSQACLIIAHDPQRAVARHALAGPAVRLTDPIRSVQRLFADWVTEGGSRSLIALYRNLDLQLSQVRRAEPNVLDGLAEEAGELQGLPPDSSPSRRASLIQRFHVRRIAVADQLARVLVEGT